MPSGIQPVSRHLSLVLAHHKYKWLLHRLVRHSQISRHPEVLSGRFHFLLQQLRINTRR
jgi:hypothetical protein